MKKLSILIFTFLIGIFLNFQLSSCGNNNCNHHNANMHEHDYHHGHSEYKDGKWICPMGCEGDSVHNKPGACSVCGMELKKVEE